MGNIQSRTKLAYDELCRTQEQNLNQPTSQALEEELAAQKQWEKLLVIEEQYLRQKSKVHRLKLGDKNNAYFQHIAKKRQLQNSIREIRDVHGNNLTDIQDIKVEATRFFQEFMTVVPSDLNFPTVPVLDALVLFECTEQDKEALLQEVTTEEIKDTLFRMPKNKAPGPDGYTSEFYTATWDIIGDDFVMAVKSFFQLGFLPKGINSTILALIPKKEKVEEMRDFRPISCCNVLYKIISKILANRLKLILPRAILRNQSAFVEGRLLMENVLMATELVKDYHKDAVSRRCAAKIDISKAFDTVQWRFLSDTLTAMAVPSRFIHWIMLCVTTASFSVQVNGELSGYFSSKRGLHQGCSLSLYLFVICMNV